MKKSFLGFILLSVAMTVAAQTNFRPLSFAEGVAAAKAEGKLVFIDFFTTWCGPCNMMAQTVFPQPKVGDYFNDRFVCMKIDAEKGEGVKLAKRFGVTGYPTFLVLDSDEKVLGSKVGAIFDIREFVSAIDRIADPEKRPERLKARYDGGERSAELIEAYAGHLVEAARQGSATNQDQIDEAYRMVKDYFDKLTDSQKTAKENAFIYLCYSESPMDEYGRYMTEHFKDFDPVVKQDISECVATLYETYIIATFTGHRPFSPEEYATVKQDIETLGLNKNGRYTPVFKLIEEYAKGDLRAFLSLCEQEYAHLLESDKRNLVLGMTDLMNTKDEAVLRHAARFIREQLPDMSVADIYFAAGIIDRLESKNSQLRSIVPATTAKRK